MPLPRLLFILLVTLAGTVVEAKPRWFRMQTEHCEIYSCSSERETIKIAERLEQFRWGALQITQMRPAYEPPIVMVVFDSESQMRPYAPLYQGKPKEVSGVFSSNPYEATIMVYANTDLDFTMRTVAHEYVHFLVKSRKLVLPTWLNEGLAELFETLQTDNDKVVFGQAAEDQLRCLRRERLLPLQQLFAIGHNSKEYNEGDQRHLFYAQSWLLVHYWMCGAEQDKVQKFRNFTNSLVSPELGTEEAFAKAFGMDFAAMETELEGYLRHGRYVMPTLRGKLPDVRSTLKAQPIGDAERDLVLWSLKWTMQQAEVADAQLRLLADQLPSNPRPYEWLAMIASSRNETAAARDYLQKAYDRGSRKTWVLYALAKEVDQQLRTGGRLDFRMPEKQSAQMRSWLDQALAQDPHFTPALEILAMVEAFSAEPRLEVVNRLQQSIGLVEDRRRFLLMLAIVRWHVQDEATCRKLLNLLISVPVPPPRPVAQKVETPGSLSGARVNLGSPPAARRMDQTLAWAKQLLARLDRQAARKAAEAAEAPAAGESAGP